MDDIHTHVAFAAGPAAPTTIVAVAVDVDIKMVMMNRLVDVHECSHCFCLKTCVEWNL